MVPHLQHADAPERPGIDGRLHDLLLGVACEQYARRPMPSDHHDARLVGGSVDDWLERPDNVQGDRTNVQLVASTEFPYRAGPACLVHRIDRCIGS